ncbi:putative serine/threonine protein phosphatase [Cafeteria roenbergensis virus]|uniref:protein-serine/threonine phosphatase n=1 Tax=Cafeteria roenbergensis virus (strain BV-PW1) TaxID=693272 RepID=E3T5U6_CROVB|nr:putative serine/threonine protein phosphatase [Cafeteria roenbergensis virus BV-PW1]ADO67559.1 putative serine/threonine protein phosphatase [Cafeteria roenbergensis virus BV-PW1]
MSYQNKYLKYKNKYLHLKKMIGGNIDEETPKFKVTTNLDRLFIADKDNNMYFDSLFSPEELSESVGVSEATKLLKHFNENINGTNIGNIMSILTFKEKRDDNPDIKNIFNQRELTKIDLIKLFYILSPNSLNKDNARASIALVDEFLLNEKLERMIALYKPQIDNKDKYYSNTLITELDRSFTDFSANQDVYYAQKITIPDDSEIHYIGDIHGSLMSLIKILVKDLGKNIDNDLILKPKHYIFFTGDIVDYSQLGLECLYLISILKLLNPAQVFICDGNHEDHDQYMQTGEKHLRHEINTEITIPRFRNNVHKFLKLFPTVIFVSYNGSLFQFNHGSHPIINKESLPKATNPRESPHIMLNRRCKTADTFKLKEYLDSDKEFLLMSYGKTYASNTYKSAGYEFKWGDFVQKFVGDVVQARPQRTLKDTQNYLDYFKIQCIFSGHQDVAPLSIMANKLIEGTDPAFKAKNNGYELTVGYYNLLGFPPIKNFGSGNWKNITFIEETRINPLTSDGLYSTGKYVDLPTEQKYEFVFNPSKYSKGNTILNTDNRILAMIQSSAGISHGKMVNYTSVSTLTTNDTPSTGSSAAASSGSAAAAASSGSAAAAAAASSGSVVADTAATASYGFADEAFIDETPPDYGSFYEAFGTGQ